MHLDCQQVDLLQEIQADIAIELVGVEEAPGVKEGGILEHVTRDITIEALPTAIPDEGLSVDVSAMIIGDTIQLSAVEAPEGVKFMADAPEEITIATLNPPQGRRGGARGRGGDRGDRRGRGRGRGRRCRLRRVRQAGDEGDSGSEG